MGRPANIPPLRAAAAHGLASQPAASLPPCQVAVQTPRNMAEDSNSVTYKGMREALREHEEGVRGGLKPDARSRAFFATLRVCSGGGARLAVCRAAQMHAEGGARHEHATATPAPSPGPVCRRLQPTWARRPPLLPICRRYWCRWWMRRTWACAA